MHKMKLFAPTAEIVGCPKGTAAQHFTAGDFILLNKPDFYGFFIKIGQRIRFQKPFSEFTHAAMIINYRGDLLEADSNGVKIVPLSSYLERDYTLIKIQASDSDRLEAVNFARACYGQTYGWITIVSVALSLLTGLKFSFGFSGQEICSGLVCRALERTSFIPPIDAAHTTPADLATWFLTPKTTS